MHMKMHGGGNKRTVQVALYGFEDAEERSTNCVPWYCVNSKIPPRYWVILSLQITNMRLPCYVYGYQMLQLIWLPRECGNAQSLYPLQSPRVWGPGYSKISIWLHSETLGCKELKYLTTMLRAKSVGTRGWGWNFPYDEVVMARSRFCIWKSFKMQTSAFAQLGVHGTMPQRLCFTTPIQDKLHILLILTGNSCTFCKIL